MLTIRRFEERAWPTIWPAKSLASCIVISARRRSRRRVLRARTGDRSSRRIAATAIASPRAPTQPHDGRALRPADRLLQGQGRLDAHRRFRRRHARRERHRRGGIAIVVGAGLAAQMEGSGVAVSFFGDGASKRAVPRMAQHGGDLEVADALRVREQPVRGEHAADATRGLSDEAAGAAGNGIPGGWSTATTCSRWIGGQRAVARTRRARPESDRVPDLPPRGQNERRGRPMYATSRDRCAGKGETRSRGSSGAAGRWATSTMPSCRRGSATSCAVEAAVAFAEASPFPLPEQATDDVFAA